MSAPPAQPGVGDRNVAAPWPPALVYAAHAITFTCRVLTLISLLAAVAGPNLLAGEVKFDGSLGAPGALSGPNFLIPADRGKQVGGNLFHSFSDFHLIKDDVATFQGPANVQNILARVTGGTASNIDGTLRSEIAGANLYLLNSAGVIFGPNAQLDLSGSFTVTTADFVKLADGGRFNVVPGASDSLTAAPVSAFGFLTNTPAAVNFNGSNLAVPEGAGLTVIAGDITLDGAALAAPGGTLALLSARSAGELATPPANPTVNFRAATFTAGDVVLRGGATASIDSVRGGGKVVIRGGKLTVTESSAISARNQGANPGGTVELTAETMAFLLGGRAVAAAQGTGRGGEISVKTGELTVDGNDGARASSVRSNAENDTGDAGSLVVEAQNVVLTNGGDLNGDTQSAGRGADVTVTVTAGVGTVDLLSGGQIASIVFGSGHGGNVSVFANSIAIDGGGDDVLFTGFFADTFGSGNAGNVLVQAGEVTLLNHGLIASGAFDTGQGGSVTVEADALRIDGAGTDLFTGISANGENGSGSAGNVSVQAGDLKILNHGQITSETFRDGDGGGVAVTATSLTIDGGVSASFTGIAGNANRGSTGDGGDVVVKVDRLTISNGEIAATTFSIGKAGNVSVTANSLSMDGLGSPFFLTGIAAQADRGSSGNAGDVMVKAGQVKLIGGAEISTNTLSSGKAGNVSLTANSVSILSAGMIGSGTSGSGEGGGVSVTANSLSIDAGGISAQANPGSSGSAGDVRVRAGDLKIVNLGTISSGTFGSGDGGGVTVTADSLSIDGRGLPGTTGISASAGTGSSGDAGDVVVRAGDLKIINAGLIATGTFSRGNGGSVSVTATSLSINGGGAAGFTGITAQTNPGSSGNAGGVAVKAGDLKIANLGSIASSTFGRGNGGSVSVTANSLLIDGRGLNGFTGIAARAERGSTGHAGDVLVAAGSFALRKNGGVTAASATSAPSGSVRLAAKNVQLDSGSSVSSENTASGPAGSVLLRVRGPLMLDSASRITTSAAQGDAGSIEIHASDRIALHRRSSIASSAGRNGGNISITGSEMVYLTDSSITATAGTQLAPGGTGGAGGNITVATRYVVLDHAVISANAALGRGGNIALESDFFLQSSILITATGAQAGTVVIAAPELDLSAGLVELPGSLFDASSLLREQCARRLGLDFSSFLVIGRGGVSLAPDEALASERQRRREKPAF